MFFSMEKESTWGQMEADKEQRNSEREGALVFVL